MPTWAAAALAVIGNALASIARSVLALLVAREVGRLGAENEALAEEQKQVAQANEIYDDDPDKYPDPYVRD